MISVPAACTWAASACVERGVDAELTRSRVPQSLQPLKHELPWTVQVALEYPRRPDERRAAQTIPETLDIEVTWPHLKALKRVLSRHEAKVLLVLERPEIDHLDETAINLRRAQERRHHLGQGVLDEGGLHRGPCRHELDGLLTHMDVVVCYAAEERTEMPVMKQQQA
jgi:hypothetical protein